jgi:hypothetical protein
MAKFVSLNSDIAAQNAKNPALFTAITRRAKGRKVLECFVPLKPVCQQ